VNDIDFPFPDVPRQSKLTRDALKMIEAFQDRVRQYRHFRPKVLQQRALRPEACDFHIESGGIQPICDVNKLLLRTAYIEMVQELQNSDTTRICAHDIRVGAFRLPMRLMMPEVRRLSPLRSFGSFCDGTAVPSQMVV
jgi:hypothetical protein